MNDTVRLLLDYYIRTLVIAMSKILQIIITQNEIFRKNLLRMSLREFFQAGTVCI